MTLRQMASMTAPGRRDAAPNRSCGRPLNGLPIIGILVSVLAVPTVAQDPGGVDEAVVRYELSQARGRPGDVVDVRLEVTSLLPLKSVSVAITFDAALLRAENVIRVSPTLDDAQLLPEGLLEVLINNPLNEAVFDPATPPEDSTQQGFISLKLSSPDESLLFTEEQPVLAFLLQFAILSPPENLELPFVVPIRFETIDPLPAPPGAPPEDPLDNFVEEPEGAQRGADDLEDGGVIILGLGEVGFFRRADANLDCAIDLGDSIFTFGFLFRGRPQPSCEDAADSNDDGTMDVSDGVFTLQWLFVSGQQPPEPLDYGPDPTPDSLNCTAFPDPCP